MKLALFLLVVVCFLSCVVCESVSKQAANETSFECDLCEVTVVLAEELIKADNLTSAEVLADLKKLCKIIPTNYTTECNIFMLVVAPQIIKDLENGENAETLCAKYHMCNSTEIISFQNSNKNSNKDSHTDNENWTVCKVITLARNYILDQKNTDGVAREDFTPELIKDFSKQQSGGRLTVKDC